MRPISVCMPYWNRRAELDRSLAAYRRVYPELELSFSICDDGSDPPLEVAGCDVHRLPMKRHAMNPCVPINVAVRASKHDVIVLTNPEIEHREPVLVEMLDSLRSKNDYITTGCRDTRTGEWFASPERDYGGFLMPRGTHFHFCAMFTRELFERAEGFDEDYRAGHAYDDNDWLWRLYALGDVNFKYVPGVTWHHKDPRAPSLWRGPQLARNRALLVKKWGHLEEFRRCVS